MLQIASPGNYNSKIFSLKYNNLNKILKKRNSKDPRGKNVNQFYYLLEDKKRKKTRKRKNKFHYYTKKIALCI